MTGEARVTLNDEDLRELFALFSSPTDEEVHQVFDPLHTNFYKRENPARDAWRAVTYFLRRKRFN